MEVPERLGRYELLARLAAGGMGEVHLARLVGRAGFEKLVVLKRLLPELAPSREHIDMLLDEARLVARLSHPNVCEVYDLGEDGGQLYIVMQYLEGVPFAALMRGAVDARLVAGALAQAAEGLHHAHELADRDGRPLGVVHRDVSPSNLMVTSDGVVKVLDFGIAKARIGTSVTERGVLKGKLAYMSPEQLAEGPIDRRADVFCLGIVAWDAVCGAPLFARESAVATANAVLGDVVPDVREKAAGTPAGLAAAIAKALERDPGKRFATARELGAALAAGVAEVGGGDERAGDRGHRRDAVWRIDAQGNERRLRRQRLRGRAARAHGPPVPVHPPQAARPRRRQAKQMTKPSLLIALTSLLLACGPSARAGGTNAPPPEPKTPAVTSAVGILIAHQADLALTDDQLAKLQALDEQLEKVNAPLEKEADQAEHPTPSDDDDHGNAPPPNMAGAGMPRGTMHIGPRRGGGSSAPRPHRSEHGAADPERAAQLRRRMADNEAGVLRQALDLLDDQQRLRAKAILDAEGYELPGDSDGDAAPGDAPPGDE